MSALTSIAVWLLIVGGGSNRPPVVIDRFIAEADCQSAALIMKDVGYGSPVCYPAKVLKP